MVSRCLVDDLSDNVYRCEDETDSGVDGRPLGVVSVAAACMDRRDDVSDDRNVFKIAHYPVKNCLTTSQSTLLQSSLPMSQNALRYIVINIYKHIRSSQYFAS